MSHVDQMTPLYDRLLVQRLKLKDSLIQCVRENSDLIDYVGQGDNGNHADNRRVFLMSRVLSVGCAVKGVKKGDLILHTAWNDLPPWFEAPKDYAMIRENDVAGTSDDPGAFGYEA